MQKITLLHLHKISLHIFGEESRRLVNRSPFHAFDLSCRFWYRKSRHVVIQLMNTLVCFQGLEVKVCVGKQSLWKNVCFWCMPHLQNDDNICSAGKATAGPTAPYNITSTGQPSRMQLRTYPGHAEIPDVVCYESARRPYSGVASLTYRGSIMQARV
jgi:hypothetical protein